MFDRQLIPLDGSEAARVALTYAASIPSRSVSLLMVLPLDDVFEGIALAGRQEPRIESARDSAGRYLRTAAKELEAQGRMIEIVVAFGEPADQILEHAADVDLIIMTTHGYGAGRRVVYGSVADRIGRQSPTQVMLIRRGEHPIHARPVQRIVAPLDGSDLAEAALPAAADLADTLGVPVVLARALDAEEIRRAMQLGSSPIASYANSIGVVRQAASEYLEGHAQALRNRSIPVSIEVRDGAPAPELLDLAGAGDLLVMTSHGRGGVGRWMLGSVSEKLVRQAKCPVLLIRSQAAAAS
ncbi:universal stress protein [soil metagenome]